MKLGQMVVWALFSSRLLIAQANFPAPIFQLQDVKHKLQKNGVQVDGNVLTIRSGVGTPTTINVLAFSNDGSLLAAGMDFGRVVVWNITTHAVAHVVETGQGIVSAVAISPDNQFIATAGREKNGQLTLWNLDSGKLTRTIDISRTPVQSLEFCPKGDCLVVTENGTAIVFDPVHGGTLLDLQALSERMPVLSRDGSVLMTASGDDFILRRVADWKVMRSFPKPVKYAWPLALDTQTGTYVYGEPNGKPGFVVANLDADHPTNITGPSLLPQFNPSTGFFASPDISSGIVFGHSGARLWAWSPKSGKSCLSDVLYSESGKLSPNGLFVASAVDNGVFAAKKAAPGVLVWSTVSVIDSCSLLKP
ncbi:WD domain-containing protein, G-beta repeat-containing protein [Granulicella rosea]|uniref:WD domain-containing protein, G-beta repeat-containing protein n=1 Tax=Granulicella rosea TaxID=474952 RepID=A0A239KRY2_9BACT|nr:hypothetical protein [Granulicella rosea]SNT20428.1 WD domain-containing protein, G-beta repeat-containing protein [Granulicella rosea]